MKKKILSLFTVVLIMVSSVLTAIPASAELDTTKLDNWFKNSDNSFDGFIDNLISIGMEHGWSASDYTNYFCIVSTTESNGSYAVFLYHYSYDIEYTYTSSDLNALYVSAKRDFLYYIPTKSSFQWQSGRDYSSDDIPFDSYKLVSHKGSIMINEVDYSQPEQPTAPVPFTVSYTPELSENMINSVFYPSKQGANGEYVEQESNDITVTVKLTDEFINNTTPVSGSFVYSYEFTTFCIPSEFKSDSLSDMSEHSIYTAINTSNFLYYENETLDVGLEYEGQPSTGEVAKPVEQWANANGVTNLFVIPRSYDGHSTSNSVSFNIDIQNIPFSKTSSTSFTFVTVGHAIRLTEYGWTAFPYYFKSSSTPTLESSEQYAKDFYYYDFSTYEGTSDSELEAYKAEHSFYLYSYYTDFSDDFNYSDPPDFVPLTFTDSDGNTYTLGGKPLDFDNLANKVQDYDMKGNDEWKTEDDFTEYKNDKILASQFDVTDFTNVEDIFSTSGIYFKFLTASLSILPSWFYATFMAWFVVVLGIVIVKFVLK